MGRIEQVGGVDLLLSDYLFFSTRLHSAALGIGNGIEVWCPAVGMA